MERRIYKALDKPSSVLGIQGTYKKYAITGIVVAAVVGAAVAKATVGLLGFGVFAGLGALVYFGVLRFQAKYSERERDKMLASKALPDCVVMPPYRLSRLSNRMVTKKSD